MKRFISASSNRIMSAGVALATTIVLLAPCAALATPYVVKITQQGTNVVASGSGALDLAGLGLIATAPGSMPQLNPSTSNLITGAKPATVYVFSAPISGPSNFGTHAKITGSEGTGDQVGIDGRGKVLIVPSGYSGGGALSSTATWENTSFASLGMTPGSYVWTWGNGTEQSFTLDILSATSAVPEPAALGMFGMGVLLIGAFVGLRRRRA